MIDKNKFLEGVKEELIYDSSVDKKAIPELLLKQAIIISERDMIDAFENMIFHFKMYNRFIFQDVIMFECKILKLFNYIKAMMIDYGISGNDLETYKLLVRCELGEHFNAKTLIIFKNFLLKYLHLLNITNLFKSQGLPFDIKIKEQY